jgi:hypothetical protein
MILSKLNGIAARIAIAIVLAIALGLLMAFGLGMGLNTYGFRQDRSPYASQRLIFIAVITHRNLMMLSGEIAMTIRAAASMPWPERQQFIAIAAIAAPEIQIALDAPREARSGTEASAGVDYSLDRLRKLVEVQLKEVSPPITVSVRRSPVQTNRSADRDDSWSGVEQDAVVEAGLPDGQRITFTIVGLPSLGGYLVPIFLGSLVLVALLIALLTARRLARPIREFASASERLGIDLTAPPLAVRGPQELRAPRSRLSTGCRTGCGAFSRTAPRCWLRSPMTSGRRWRGCACAPNSSLMASSSARCLTISRS